MAKPDETSHPQDPFDQLHAKLDEGERKWKLLADKGRDLTEAGQFMVDLSQATREAVKVYQPPHHVEFLNSDWDTLNSQADLVLGQLGELDLPAFNSTGGTAAYTTTDAFSMEEVQHHFSPHEWPKVSPIIRRVHQVTSRIAAKDDVVALMVSFGLDIPQPGRKSALEQFETAHAAFEKPITSANPISTSLIPMREAIRAAIDHLLRSRPQQEKATAERAKIHSIASQLARGSIQRETVQSWADQWARMLNEDLSSSKNQEISREVWQQRLNRSTLFLKSLLTGLDPARLSKP